VLFRGASVLAILRCAASFGLSCVASFSFSPTLAQPPDDFYTRGKAALEAKRYAEAEQAFAQAEARSPGATNALALRAKALIHLDRFDDADRCLKTYLESYQNSADAKYLLGYVLFRMDKARESLAMYTAAAALQRPTAEDFKIVGLDYVLLNDYTDAIRWLEQSVNEAPNNVETVYYLGRAYYVQNDFDKAIAAFERALKLDPQYAKAENNLGLALEAKNQSDLAEAAFRKAIQMGEVSGKRSEQPYVNLAELLSHGDRQAEATSLLDEAEHIAGKSDRTQQLRGQIFLAQNRLPEAEAAFRAAIALKPDDGSLHYLLGRALKREGKLDDAEKEFAQTKRLLGTREANPREQNNLVGPHLDRARQYGTGRPFDAISELKLALEIAPENSEAKSLLRQIAKDSALAALRSEEKDKALHVLQKALQVQPHDPELLYEHGFVALDGGLYREAQQSLESALAIQPDYPDATYALARTYLKENMAQSAEQQMRKYLAQKPNDATAQYGLGYVLMAEQQLDEAKHAFEKSFALQPNQTESIFQLGEIAVQQGQNDTASEDFRKVLSRDPRHGGALTEIGVLAYRASKYDEAKIDLERAIESAPSYQKAHYYYALTLSKLGRKTEADHEFTISKNLQKEHGAELHLAATQP
jgi:tetratricopeptide (TPR) repeat protein